MSTNEINLSISEFLEKINQQPKRKKNEIIIDGEVVIKRRSIRLKTFQQKGVRCVYCKSLPQRVVFRRNQYRPGRWTFEISGYRNDGRYFYMTTDHIVPRAHGGSNRIENLQPLCNHCNSKKGNKRVVESTRLYNLNEVLDTVYVLNQDKNRANHFKKFKKRWMKYRCRQNHKSCAMVYHDELIRILNKINYRYGFNLHTDMFVPRLVPKLD